MRVSYEEMTAQFARVLASRGFDGASAKEAAAIFAQNSLAGVPSHGLNRFPRVVEYLDKGLIDPAVKAECVLSLGALERWDGHQGFGPLSARRAMDRACALARQYGIGLVALGNNNHWMRGGTYGWQAAEQGCIGICWSNTMPNMPAWGGKDCRLGNNPLVLAVPRANGRHVVADLALSQFSYGKLEDCRLHGRPLPVPGGYDAEGSLTTDPAAIEATRRMLPAGYWKGSGLSLCLDLIVTLLSGGPAVHTIGSFPEEVGLSQVFIAIDPARANTPEESERMVEEILADLKASVPIKEGEPVRYPAEREAENIRENRQNGIPVVEEKWAQVLAM